MYLERGERGLIHKKPIPGTHPNRTPDEIVEKILNLRKKYHLGPTRIMCYMARYHDLKVSDANISRVLKRHGVSSLPRYVSGTVAWLASDSADFATGTIIPVNGGWLFG